MESGIELGPGERLAMRSKPIPIRKDSRCFFAKISLDNFNCILSIKHQIVKTQVDGSSKHRLSVLHCVLRKIRSVLRFESPFLSPSCKPIGNF